MGAGAMKDAGAERVSWMISSILDFWAWMMDRWYRSPVVPGVELELELEASWEKKWVLPWSMARMGCMRTPSSPSVALAIVEDVSPDECLRGVAMRFPPWVCLL